MCVMTHSITWCASVDEVEFIIWLILYRILYRKLFSNIEFYIEMCCLCHLWHDSFDHVVCLSGWGVIHHLTHSNIEFYIEMCCLCHTWHDSFYIWLILIPIESTTVTRLIQIRDMIHFNMRDSTPSTMWHDPRMRNQRHDTLICVPWLILYRILYRMTCLCHMWHDSFYIWLIFDHVIEWVMSHIFRWITSRQWMRWKSSIPNIVCFIGLFCKRDP